MDKKSIVLCLLLVSFVLIMGPVSCSNPVEQQQSNAAWGITNFPDPRSFTQEIVNLPNPFVSWHGNTVTAANWDLRRAELSQIIQHYLTGYKHPDEGFISEIINISNPNTNGTRLLTIRVTREETGDSATFIANVNTPAENAPDGGFPVVMIVSMSAGNVNTPANPTNYALMSARGYGSIGLPMYAICGRDDSGPQEFINARMDQGMVPVLFPEVNYWSASDPRAALLDDDFQRYDTRNGWLDDYADEDAPGRMMNWVWGISRLIDAFEAYNAETAVEDRLFNINPAKIAITGMSRMGKLAVFAAAFEERIAVAAPADTCAAGLNIDRFVSISVNEADSHTNFPINWRSPSDPKMMNQGYDNANWPPYNPDRTDGFGPFDSKGPLNKYYQYVKFEEIMSGTGASTLIRARTVTAGEALIDPTRDLNGGVTKAFPALGQAGTMGHVLWKGVPELAGASYAAYVDNDATNINDGYGVHVHAYQYNQPAGVFDRAWAPQTMTDMRTMYPNHWNSRFQRMPLIFPDLNIHARHLRADWGYFANAPFDMHYVSSLIAPRPMIMFGGMTSANSGMETAFMNFLAVREVYRLLGEEDNVGIAVYMHAHTQPAQTYQDIMDFCDAHYNNTAAPARFLPKAVDEYPYAINDPRSRYDYVKLNWAAPGYESIASQVERLVPANATSWDEITIK